MKQQQKQNEHTPGWKGYSFDELRYQQAYTAARLEIERERMVATSRVLYGGAVGGRASGIIGKMFAGLSYVDYAVLAFRLGRRVYSLFHRNR